MVSEGAVLLQNEGPASEECPHCAGLPLKGFSSSSTVAIIGALANDNQSQCGGYTGFGAEVTTVLGAAPQYDPLHNRSFTHLFLLAAFHSKSMGVLQLSASVPLLESLSMNL